MTNNVKMKESIDKRRDIWAREESLDSLVNKLKMDRLIKLYIGAEAIEPYLVQQRLLEQHSPYFVKALQNSVFQEGIDGAITLKEDDEVAWKFLLYWLLSGRLHPDIHGDASLAIKCWVLGDKYGIVGFQDEAMLIILLTIDENHRCDVSRLEVSTIREAVLSTAPGSKMRLLMAQETVIATHASEDFTENFFVLEGLFFFSEYAAANRRWNKEKKTNWVRRFDKSVGRGEAAFREFMIGPGPLEPTNTIDGLWDD